MTDQPVTKKSPLSELDVITCECRLSFPALAEKKSNGPDSAKSSYQATLLIPPGTDMAPFNKAMRAAILKKFSKPTVTGLRNPIRNAAEKEYAGYDEGWLFIATKSDVQIPIVDRQKIPIVDLAKVYAGCWVKAHIRAWAYNNQFGKGVSFELKALQFIKDGDRLDGRGKPSDPDMVFEALELDEPAAGEAADDNFNPFG